MLTHVLTACSDGLWWAGVAAFVIGSVWFLFASYRCDVSLARWTLVFPPLAMWLVVRYPETCLRPFLVLVASLVLMGVGSAYSPEATSKQPDLTLPGALSN